MRPRHIDPLDVSIPARFTIPWASLSLCITFSSNADAIPLLCGQTDGSAVRTELLIARVRVCARDFSSLYYGFILSLSELVFFEKFISTV